MDAFHLMAAVVLPEHVGEAGADLGEYFDRHHRWFFVLFLVTLVISVSKDVVLGRRRLPNATNLAFHGLSYIGILFASLR